MVKNLPANVGDAGNSGSIPRLGRYPVEGNGNPLQCSCLENPHEQRSLVSHSPWGCKGVRHNLATEHRHTHSQYIKAMTYFQVADIFIHP